MENTKQKPEIWNLQIRNIVPTNYLFTEQVQTSVNELILPF